MSEYPINFKFGVVIEKVFGEIARIATVLLEIKGPADDSAFFYWKYTSDA